jgi:holo-[acyl-carrier protein] synthase
MGRCSEHSQTHVVSVTRCQYPAWTPVTMTKMRIIGHGIDIVEIARIEAMLAEHGERFVERCFTEVERAYADSGSKRRAERYAARFAAKEAVLKVLGTGWRDGISWRDIGVIREPSGRPALEIGGRCAELASQLRIERWEISLSHTNTLAMASVIGCGECGQSPTHSEAPTNHGDTEARRTEKT